jgi:hypothetical protein
MIYYLSKEKYKYIKIPVSKWLTVLFIISSLSFIAGKNYAKTICDIKKEKHD